MNKEFNLHFCDNNERYRFECSQDTEGNLKLSANGEYECAINYCPFCGFSIDLLGRERSKREDLDCVDCEVTKRNVQLSCDVMFLQSLIDESKMRCSEHCGNTVRKVQ